MAAPTNVMFMACGSFSPPTHMHMRMFELARDHFRELGHNVIGGIVSPVHDAYAKKGLIASTHRATMIKMALQSSKWVRMSDWECKEQQQWTPTRQSLQYHQNYLNSYLQDSNGYADTATWLPGNLHECQGIGNIQLKLLCGADLLESFAVPGLWKQADIEAILQEHGLVVISRNGSNPERFIFESDILTKYKRHITIVTNWVANEVSSSIARRLLGRGLSVKYLLDDGVIDYIQQNELYGNTTTTKYILSPNQNTVVLTSTAEQRNNNNINNGIQLSLVNYRYDDDMDETDAHTYPKSTTPPNLELSGAAKRPPPRVFCCGDPLNVKSLLSRPGGAVQVVAGAVANTLANRHIDAVAAAASNNEVGPAAPKPAPPPLPQSPPLTPPHTAHKHNVNTAVEYTLRPRVTASPPQQRTTNTPKPKPLSPVPPSAHLLKTDRGRVQFLSDNHLDELGIDRPDQRSVWRPTHGNSSCSGDDFDDDEESVSAESMPSTSDRTQDDLIQFVFTSHGIRVISDKEYVV